MKQENLNDKIENAPKSSLGCFVLKSPVRQLIRMAPGFRGCEIKQGSLKGSNITAQGNALGKKRKCINVAIRAVIEKLWQPCDVNLLDLYLKKQKTDWMFSHSLVNPKIRASNFRNT